jgi:hypothetical protein
MTIQSDLPGESSPSTAPPSSEQASSSAPVSSAAEAQAGPSDGDLAQEPTFSTQRKKRRRKRGRGRRNKQPSEPTPVDEPANSYDAISECGSSCTEASSYEETDPLLDRSRARGPRPSELEAGLVGCAHRSSHYVGSRSVIEAPATKRKRLSYFYHLIYCPVDFGYSHCSINCRTYLLGTGANLQ